MTTRRTRTASRHSAPDWPGCRDLMKVTAVLAEGKSLLKGGLFLLRGFAGFESLFGDLVHAYH
jgi:hypothetical protein